MNVLNNFHCYINLEQRIKRKIECEKQLISIGITKPNRFNAIKDDIGLVGCVKSHIECINNAKDNYWPFVCIFEDDIFFPYPENVLKKINQYINSDYDVLLIGAWIKDNKYSILNKDLIKVNNCECAHAYIIKNHYYDILLDNYKNSMKLKTIYPDNHNYNIDVYTHTLQKKDKWYCFNPILATQTDGYSDNFNKIRNYQEIIMNIPLQDINLPKVTILTPTFNRRKFLRLMISNIKFFDYPKDKLEWLILDSLGKDGEKGDRLFNNTDEIENIKKMLGIEINYHYIDDKMSIGSKRNWLSQNSRYDILINMDDDDIYLVKYIKQSVEILLNFNKDIVGCLNMLFIYPNDNYKIGFIQCKGYELYDEASLCMKKTHWEKYKYINNSEGEGRQIYGKEELCGIINSYDSIICVCWEGNTINKEYFKKNIIDLNIHGEQINILKNIFNKIEVNKIEVNKIEVNKIEVNKIEVNKENHNVNLIKVDIDLLKQFRGLIEIINNRIKWKTNELLPVGRIVKQLDDILENYIK